MTDGTPFADGRVGSRFAARNRTDSRWSAVVVAFVLVTAFGLAGGLLGGLAGATTVLVWYVVGTPYAIAVGHVVLVAVFHGGIDPIAFAVVEAGFLVMMLEPAIRSEAPGRVGAVTLGASVALGGLAWLVVRSQPLWLAAAVTIGGLTLASYGLYRYGLVMFGLVEDSEAPHNEPHNDGDDV
ncbi:hypothetical protein [Natronococcus wangiae]|uniref:hypothetical protein n=1 Tax=Natronococcus wangiae TaxID=3068275 RepID=UPI00273F6EA4|nr:hypothetical protein [Natronococcus sp. AD5]